MIDQQPSLAVILRQKIGSQNTHYVHGLRGVQSQVANSAWTEAMSDGLGSVRGWLNSSQAFTDTNTFDPYGVPDSAVNGFGFTGEMTDANGLVYLRARYYDPNAGVFASLDPFEGVHNRPMSVNGYSWVEGNVANWTDASGKNVMLATALNSGICNLNQENAICNCFDDMWLNDLCRQGIISCPITPQTFMDSMPYICTQATGVFDEYTGVVNSSRKDYTRAGDAQRAFWAYETLMSVIEELGVRPNNAQLLAATFFQEAATSINLIAEHTCAYAQYITREGTNQAEWVPVPTCNNLPQGVVCEYRCDDRFPRVEYRNRYTIGQALQLQSVAYMFYYCPSGICNDLEMAMVLGKYEPWSNRNILALVNRLRLIMDPQNSDYDTVKELGEQAINLSQIWLRDGLQQIPTNTPYSYRGAGIFNPGYTTICPPSSP